MSRAEQGLTAMLDYVQALGAALFTALAVGWHEGAPVYTRALSSKDIWRGLAADWASFTADSRRHGRGGHADCDTGGEVAQHADLARPWNAARQASMLFVLLLLNIAV